MTDDLTQEKINLLQELKAKLKERDDVTQESLNELISESDDDMTKQEEHGAIDYLSGKSAANLHAAVKINRKIDELKSS